MSTDARVKAFRGMLQVMLNAFPKASVCVEFQHPAVIIKAAVGTHHVRWVEYSLTVRTDLSEGFLTVVGHQEVDGPANGTLVSTEPMETPSDIIGALSWYAGELPPKTLNEPFWDPRYVENLPNLAYLDQHLLFQADHVRDILTCESPGQWTTRWAGSSDHESEYLVSMVRTGDPDCALAQINKLRPGHEDMVGVTDPAELVEVLEVLEERAVGIIRGMGLPGPTAKPFRPTPMTAESDPRVLGEDPKLGSKADLDDLLDDIFE